MPRRDRDSGFFFPSSSVELLVYFPSYNVSNVYKKERVFFSFYVDFFLLQDISPYEELTQKQIS